MAEPQPIREAHEEARRIRRDAERRARDMMDDARRQAQDLLREAHEAADAVLEDAKALREALHTTSEALTGEADRLARDVQLAHRELLASLRLPGVAARPERRRPGAGDIFEPPGWTGGR